MDDRIKRICKLYEKRPQKAKDLIIKTDKKRANYYNYYSSKKWGDARSYHLCLNSSILGIDGTVDAIIEYLKVKSAAKNR